MLAYVLALAVFIGSIGIYIAAFFFPEIHKKNDFIWSGVGLFYGLVLWIFAHRISGGLLLGHIASVSLLYWFGWQTLALRRQLVPAAQQTPVPTTQSVKATVEASINKVSLPQRIGQLQRSITGVFSGAKTKAQETIKKTKPQDTTSATASPAQIIDALIEEAPPVSGVVNSTIEIKPAEAIPPNPPSPELVEAAQATTEEAPTPPVEEPTEQTN